MRVAFVCDRAFAVMGGGIGAEVLIQCVWGPAGRFFSLQTRSLFFESLGKADFEGFFLRLEVFFGLCKRSFRFEELVVETLEFGGARGELVV